MSLPRLGTTTVRRLAFASLAAFTMSGVSHADDVDCPPALGAVTVDGNVLIAAACTMEGTTVTGNILLYAGGSLVARGLNVEGNIQADDADYVDIMESEIDGSIQLDGLVGDASNITSNRINGNIQLDDNRSRLEVLDNTVGADLQAFANSGGVVIADNTVDGNLQCKENDPAPVGSNNRVSGNTEDQCANLQPAGGDNSGAGSGSGSGDGGSAGSGGSGNEVANGGSGGGGSFSPLSLGVLLSLFIASSALRPASRLARRRIRV
jgi:uncharacterized membrane protein YgcG